MPNYGKEASALAHVSVAFALVYRNKADRNYDRLIPRSLWTLIIMLSLS